MNYSYYKYWVLTLTGKTDKLKATTDIKKCPIFFAFGGKKAHNFHSEEWANTLIKDQKDGGKS